MRKQLSVRFPDLRDLEMRVKMLCMCYHDAILRAEVGLRAGLWAAHLWWPGRGQRCTPGSCSRHSHRVPHRGPGTPPPPQSTAAAPPRGGARLPVVAPLSRVALPVGTGPTGRKQYPMQARWPSLLLPTPPSSWGSSFLAHLRLWMERVVAI